MATLDSLLLWRLTNANDCDGFFKMPNSVLQGHVIETITTTEKDCRAICRRNSACYSINFRKKSQCDLNSETHFAFPGHFNPGGASDTYYAVVKPVTRCSSMLCSSVMVCKMRKGGKAYKCGKGQFIAHFPTILHKNGLSYHPLPLINVFSVSVWFKTNIVPGSQLQTIFSIFYPPNVDAFVIDLRDKQMRIESTGDTRDISSGELRDGNWHHVVFTWSAVNGA
ncbi:uncharacterized protein LOC5518618 isoform X1 [Nematostella vectensis]|uniref:uncharacterized protein LOC5518618 isoform X1 n=2 Tax=Nematostella vectensis TaxID=45351 RepID=UPI002076E24F|nr:uncharacterized protein LOC5518618 isoform X1 [Nematostella vectensis]